MLESSDIRIIQTITELGSISKAAEVLCMTQSTLSKRLSRLESVLGLTLFYRHSSGMAATPAGNYIIEKGADISNQLTSIDRHIQMLASIDQGDINIGVGPIIEQILFPQLLIAFSEVSNNIRIKLVSGSTRRLTELLEQGEIDLALGPFIPEKLHEDFICKQIKREKIILVARENHPLLQPTSTNNIELLNQFPSIGPEIPSNIANKLSPELLNAVPTIVCENYNTAKSLVLQSDYITGGPAVLFQDEINNGKLSKISGLPEPYWESYLVVKPDAEVIPTVAKFIDVCQNLVKLA